MAVRKRSKARGAHTFGQIMIESMKEALHYAKTGDIGEGRIHHPKRISNPWAWS